jgi:proteasome lid subunit RPN8/RPN11
MITEVVKTGIYDHVYAHGNHEVGGVLVGHVDDCGNGVVTGSIAALEAVGKRASVTFTHEAWASVHQQLDRDFPDSQIVGWYHSHPGFGIFLSEHDLFIHEHFFSDARQIAYVVDPHAGTEGVFGWNDGKIVKLEQGPAGRKGLGPDRSRLGGNVGRISLLIVLVGSLCGAGAVVLLRGPASEPDGKPKPARVAPAPTATATRGG